MLYPSIDELMKKVDSKYTLVAATSKRARELKDGKPSLLQEPKSNKVVGVALEEIYHGLVEIELPNSQSGK